MCIFQDDHRVVYDIIIVMDPTEVISNVLVVHV